MSFGCVLLLPILGITSKASALSRAPDGLLVDLKPAPHTGIDRARPRLSWIVPHLDNCDAAPSGQTQSHFRMQLSDSAEFSNFIGDTGLIASESSIAVIWPGPDLAPASTCWWRVRTWTLQGCRSEWSRASKIITGTMGKGFRVAKPVWLDGAQFVFLRKDVALDSKRKVISAHAYAAAVQVGDHQEKYLGAYRLYVDGNVVGTGPGRGTRKYSEPGHPDYDTLDLTTFVAGKRAIVLALQGFNVFWTDAECKHFHSELTRTRMIKQKQRWKLDFAVFIDLAPEHHCGQRIDARFDERRVGINGVTAQRAGMV